MNHSSFSPSIIIFHPSQHGLTGQTWYSLEASRAVNQAVGRVIRHKDDYGAVILCDSRFADSNFKTQLSAWIRPYIMNYNKFGPVMKDISQFFRQALTVVGVPADGIVLSLFSFIFSFLGFQVFGGDEQVVYSVCTPPSLPSSSQCIHTKRFDLIHFTENHLI